MHLQLLEYLPFEMMYSKLLPRVGEQLTESQVQVWNLIHSSLMLSHLFMIPVVRQTSLVILGQIMMVSTPEAL
jgi:hypothetical protein